MLKIAYFLRKILTLRANNSENMKIKNAKLSGHHFYMNQMKQGDFQICISVPLNSLIQQLNVVIFKEKLKLNLLTSAQVNLPSGAYVRFNSYKWGANVEVRVSSNDYQNTSGLCGIFDDDKNNDMTSKDAGDFRESWQ